MEKETRDRNKSGDLFVDDEGYIYILLKLPLGWVAISVQGSDTYGGLQRTMSMAIKGLEPLGYSIDIKAGKRWEDE